MKSPSTTQIKRLRVRAKLTQTQAAELVHSNERTWQAWEYGQNPMHPGLWELFNIKVKTAKDSQLR
jgi:DNA-binding transcriptional regulator YiaG